MGAEFELKFTSDEQLHQALLTRFGKGETLEMESTYYDTPCGRLQKKRYTLRLRRENGICVCTVKTPMKGFGRGEWEVNASDIQKAIPQLCALGAPEELRTLTQDGVLPICGAKFTRQAILIETEPFSAELALDRGILTGKDRELPFLEIELEYKSGDMAAFLAYGEALAAEYRLITQPLSKFRRALNLYLGE